jgi:hypothetical protein
VPRGTTYRFSSADGHVEEQKAFLSGLASGTPAIPLSEQFAATRVLFAIQKALASGNKESI